MILPAAIADDLNLAFRAIDLLGVFLNGVIGGRLARSKRFDVVGFAVLAVMSALGGGIIRDVMLMTPPAAITDPYYLSTALAGALLALLLRLDSRWSVRLIIVADGLVLGSWAATGALKTLSYGYGPMPALLLGLLTAIGGGMIRDVTAGNVPMVFGGNNLYAVPGALSAITMISFYYAGWQMAGILISTLLGGSFAILAHWRRWVLPRSQEWTITMTSAQLRALLRRRGLTGKRKGKHRGESNELVKELKKVQTEAPDTPGKDLNIEVSDKDLEALRITPAELRALGVPEAKVAEMAKQLQADRRAARAKERDPLPSDNDSWFDAEIAQTRKEVQRENREAAEGQHP